MTECTLELPVHSREVPAEWPELVGLAEKYVGDGPGPKGTIPGHAASDIYGAVEALTDEQMEESRYFGLGMAMCGFARELQDENVRAQAVIAAGDDIASTFMQIYPEEPAMRVGHLTGSITLMPFGLAAKRGTRHMSRAELAVSDALLVDSHHRETTHWSSPYGGYTHSMPRARRLIDVATYDNTSDIVAGAAIAAAAGTIRVGLGKIVKTSDEHEKGPVFDPADLERLHVRRVAKSLAALRRDEFLLRRDELIWPDVRGHFRFMRKSVPKVPPRRPIGSSALEITVLHEQRLMCPAVNVPGMIALVMDITPAILKRAQETVIANHV